MRIIFRISLWTLLLAIATSCNDTGARETLAQEVIDNPYAQMIIKSNGDALVLGAQNDEKTDADRWTHIEPNFLGYSHSSKDLKDLIAILNKTYSLNLGVGDWKVNKKWAEDLQKIFTIIRGKPLRFKKIYFDRGTVHHYSPAGNDIGNAEDFKKAAYNLIDNAGLLYIPKHVSRKVISGKPSVSDGLDKSVLESEPFKLKYLRSEQVPKVLDFPRGDEVLKDLYSFDVYSK